MLDKRVFLLLLSCGTLVALSLASTPSAYRDLFRAQFNDEDFMQALSDDEISDRVFYYRSPLSAYSELAGHFGKRTVNKFKNMMLTKDFESETPIQADMPDVSSRYIPRTTGKRGVLLSWALPAANRVREMSINPPGINRPAAA